MGQWRQWGRGDVRTYGAEVGLSGNIDLAAASVKILEKVFSALGQFQTMRAWSTLALKAQTAKRLG